MKGISFNTWAYSSFPSWVPSYPLEEVIKRLSGFGYDAIEIGCAAPHAWPDYVLPEQRVKILKHLKDYNLRVSAMLPAPGGGPGMNVSSASPEERRFTINHYKDVIRLANDWECPTVIYVAGWVAFGTTQTDAWNYSLEAITEIGEFAKEKGISMAIEPTSADSNLIETADDALLLSEQTGLDNVRVMFDTYHALYRNEVSSDYVYRMADKLQHIHLADADRLPPGLGTVDYPSVLKALKEVNYDGYLSLEVGFHKRGVEPDWYARKSIEYLKQELAKLNA
ncbi:sugar phosphate isomerase/epimerase family protein [Paenibacillus polymyxa]|uniref:sugar phosphate isomerase/epimerase family protein n=1 Tax=Paenibacillus polymyxa TaxID=1406 RepID=UPI0023783EF0|nr:sugar phosphate isomerase/epimerase [Paenibacillus polymyxa]WDM21803.1 sugar phosphate isomerase/epimerase [Paenibacillus polymyxa]